MDHRTALSAELRPLRGPGTAPGPVHCEPGEVHGREPRLVPAVKYRSDCRRAGEVSCERLARDSDVMEGRGGWLCRRPLRLCGRNVGHCVRRGSLRRADPVTSICSGAGPGLKVIRWSVSSDFYLTWTT